MDTDISINRRNYFLECQCYSFFLYVWSTAKIYRKVIIVFPVFNVTLFKQRIQLLVPLNEHNKHQLSLIFINHLKCLYIYVIIY